MEGLTLEQYLAAERQIAVHDARKGFGFHAAATVVVTVVLAAVNIFVAPEFPWAIFPAVGMGIGLWCHWYFGVRHGDDVMRHHQEDVERQMQHLGS
jgi:hypothetical protein